MAVLRERPRRRGRIRGQEGVRLLLLLLPLAVVAATTASGNGYAFVGGGGLRAPKARRPPPPPPTRRQWHRHPQHTPTTTTTTTITMRLRPAASSPNEPEPPTPSPASGGAVGRTALLALPGAGLYLAASAATGFALEGSVERTLAGAAVACAGLAVAAYGGALRRAGEGEDRGFGGFQRAYLGVQALATFIDFVQGPYLYKVYADTYGLGMNDIALLYLVGFGASALAAPVAGPLADTYGRRLGCLAFAGLQAASSLLLHLGPALGPLALGRLLSGTATAFLATCFEAWMVAEHAKRRFPPSLLPTTFSLQVLLLGATAIAAGGAAGAAVTAAGGSYLAPFDLCAAAAAAALVVIPLVWRAENFGGGGGQGDGEGGLWEAAKDGWGVFMAGRREVLWLGLTQACFEAALFTWVFLWTPALESTGPPIPNLDLGRVFAALMAGVVAGGAAFRLLVVPAGREKEEGQKGERQSDASLTSEQVLSGALALAAGSLGLASLPGIRGDALLAAFVLFEVAFGAYSGAMGALRARLLPEGLRATVMNQTRLLLNILIVGMYLGPLRWDLDVGTAKRPVVLGLCTGLVLLAAAAHSRLRAALEADAEEPGLGD